MVNLSARAFKAQGNNKSLRFQGTIETDGVGVSILKQNVDIGCRQKNKGEEKSASSTTANRSMSNKKMEKDEFSNIEELDNEGLLKMKDKCVLSVLIVPAEIPSSTVDQARFGNETLDNVPHDFSEPVDFKVTDSGDLYYGNRLLFITHIRRFLLDIDRNLEECSSAELTKGLAEVEINQLSHIIKETLGWLNISGFETTENYEKKKKDMMHEAHKILSKLFLLPFRKMKFPFKLYYDKCNEKQMKNVKNRFGPNAVLVIGG
ncbi:hypothetical protein BCV72DRAFT_334737 [Rhizopus microsporus var. microsporus]|uniref:Uncharacterized protein n=2 Tax=Rhizopus microsporus TaxID=58291 RepID=A0A2G4SUY9_RHIZD|nr:uncharacterized protein RHIMIDRAFT_291920 [Rhizopus microsporus ATCC 52813]ORE08060.1 hypothetical protein BCV72DRAFT_334737 [Rhizopus microsporus var. microsporus]PHZ12564.1 hypothetical protein RHIMIDRAFT_291920 [Rhizopus microsporus ATCC 52813]